jgi:hypothetical protein
MYQAHADNRQLMRTFGFSVPGNPHDRLPPLSCGAAKKMRDTVAASGLDRVRESPHRPYTYKPADLTASLAGAHTPPTAAARASPSV